MKFHQFCAQGWKHCCSTRFLGLPEGEKSRNLRNFIKNQFLREIHVFSEILHFLWNLVKFMKIMDFHDSGLKNSAKRLRFTLFTARSENDDFFMIFTKNKKKYWKRCKNKNWKHENYRKSDFSIQYAHVGAGKSAFSIFYEKSWKFTKIH